MSDDIFVPEQLPILSRGKHRSPRRGACFMELASYLAGERWSDHPACTHPLLAAVARDVNDETQDGDRPRLALLIPSVIGLTSEDPRVDAGIALQCATAALPVVSAERQRAMAVAVLACERVLDDLDDRSPGTLAATSQTALDRAPHAAQWARRFSRGLRGSPRGFRRHAAPSIAHNAVRGIAEACVPDVADRLHDLLVAAIDECTRWVDRGIDAPSEVGPATWAEVCELAGTAPPR